MKNMSKYLSMRSQTGKYIFFSEDNKSPEGKVFYSLISQEGGTLRTGSMPISSEMFIDLMGRIGFKFMSGPAKNILT